MRALRAAGLISAALLAGLVTADAPQGFQRGDAADAPAEAQAEAQQDVDAQDMDAPAGNRHRRLMFHVTDLSSRGGTNSRGNGINDLGWVGGYSNLADDHERRATLWLQGFRVDLGTLGGPNSSIAWTQKNTNGLFAGIAQTNEPDPTGELWSCRAFFPGPDNAKFVCRGVVWEWGVIRALPTLGGPNSYATAVNNRRQIVGWSQTTESDSSCIDSRMRAFHAVVWGPARDRIQPLPELDGDSASAATAINDRGQIVGISGACDQALGRHTAEHAVLWEDGKVHELDDLGGVSWTTPTSINQRGDIAGFAAHPDDPPDEPRLRAVMWRRGGPAIRNLGTLSGDEQGSSQAQGINDWGQVVGLSCSASGFCRAVLWQHGETIDLNMRKQSDYPNRLEHAQDINAFGQITGRAVTPTGERVAFIATPVWR